MFKDFLAPIHDYTDLPFRLLCQRYGAGALCVPLVSAAAIANDPSKVSLVDAHSEENNVGVQLVGAEPDWMGIAARRIADANHHVSWLNINSGCPSVRTMGCGGGSALLSKPQKIAEMIGRMRKADLPVSVKIRIFPDRGKTLALCRLLEDAGADFLVIHGRTIKQGYSGKADWETIREVKVSLGIPVIGNGDIASSLEGEARVREGFCDSYMIGRAAMSNPMCFSGKEAGPEERFSMLEEYIDLCQEHGCDALKNAKMKALNMLAGVRNASRIRDKAFRAQSVEEIIALKEIFF